VRPARLVGYAVLGVVAVALVLTFWSRVDQPAGGTAAPPPAATVAPTAVPTAGSEVAAGTDVVAADGTVYRTPTVRDAYDRVVVDVTVVAPGEGPVVVRRPGLWLVLDGHPVQPDDVGQDERRTTGGATVGFTASFPAPGIEAGDTVTVRLGTSDGTTVDVAGVAVAERLHTRPRT